MKFSLKQLPVTWLKSFKLKTIALAFCIKCFFTNAGYSEAEMIEQKQFNHGELIFREGEESDFAYLVVEGTIDIFKRTDKGTVLLSNLGAGELFGEMGLVSDAPRSASAAASGPVVVKQISGEAINYLLSQSPSEISQMLNALMERLREGNQKISRLLNKQSQFALTSDTPPEIKRVTLIPLSAALKTQLGKGMIIQMPYRVGAGTPQEGGLDINDLKITGADEYVLSRNHFSIQKTQNGLTVIDRGSRLGTIVNDTPIGRLFESDSATLTPGDNTIVAGDASSPYRFCVQWES